MTKKEIVKTISEEIGLTQLKTKEIVQKTFDAIVETLVEDRRIELRNFGVFEVKQRAARKARNPRTGAKVFVPEKFVVTFKPGKEMEEKVRQLEQQAAEARPKRQHRAHARCGAALPKVQHNQRVMAPRHATAGRQHSWQAPARLRGIVTAFKRTVGLGAKHGIRYGLQAQMQS